MRWRDQDAELRELKRTPGLEYLAVAHSDAYQQALRDLDQAFQNFFAGRAGFPRFRRRGRNDSYRVMQRPSGEQKTIMVRRTGRKSVLVKLPGLGEVRARVSRLPRGEIRSATISHGPLGWQVSLLCDNGMEAAPKRTGGLAVGLDRGVTVSVATSDGELFSVPQADAFEQRRRRTLERRLARQRKGSARRDRTKRQLGALRARDARRRRGALHKISRDLVKRYDLIAIEDLKITNMTRSAKGTIQQPGVNVAQKAGLNRVILHQGWGSLHTFLKYKSELSGSTTLSTPAPYTSQRCSRCGHTSPENRKTQAAFSCVQCGHTQHADVNAAVNVLADVQATAAGQAVAARRALSHDGSEARTTRITVLSPRSASSAALAA